MITTIPFSGFYESWHSHEIDNEIEQLVSDSSGCHPISERLNNDIWDGINWGDVMRAYAKEYAETFAAKFNREFGVNLEYESMDSPREYNFTTDRIYCTLSPEDARKLRKAVDPKLLARVAGERFTSRDGFISYYSSDVYSWGAVSSWDHNQLGTLIAALWEQCGLAEDHQGEFDIIESMTENGDVSNAVWEGLNEKGKRIADIAYYLRKRQERSYRRSA